MAYIRARTKKLALTASEFEEILGCVQHSSNSDCDDGHDHATLQALYQRLLRHAPRFRDLAQLPVRSGEGTQEQMASLARFLMHGPDLTDSERS